MKRLIILFCLFIILPDLFAQDVRLNDSVIFINNKPVALYAKELNKTILRYNMEVYSFTNYILIKAEAIKFDAPVQELKPFCYYELSFPPLNDTFAFYIEDEAFPIVLAKIIRDYKLISNDKLDRKAVNYFKSAYPGGPALAAKIKEVRDYLDETRNFKYQVVRDRTKPVSIVNGKIIMQDGVKIGWIQKDNAGPPVVNRFQTVQTTTPQGDYNTEIAGSCRIYMTSEIVAGGAYGVGINYPLSKGEIGYNLYKLSVPKKIVPRSIDDILLSRICALIENYSL